MAHWFKSPAFDIACFHAPVWACWLVALLLPPSVRQVALPLGVWVFAVLLIDVGHVWTSIFRTYCDADARRHHRLWLWVLPFACFLAAFGLSALNDQWFWRTLAYVALFHFIKQQVGICALYRVRQVASYKLDTAGHAALKRCDNLAVYAGTLLPVLYWHLVPPKSIHWFVPEDFSGRLTSLLGDFSAWPLGGIFTTLWLIIMLVWLGAQWRLSLTISIGKTLWVAGTGINWFLGIVWFDSDLIFTLTNTVAHGMPYYALVGLYVTRKAASGGYRSPRLQTLAGSLPGIVGLLVAMVVIAIVLAFGEEYLWNSQAYRDYPGAFDWLLPMPAFLEVSGWHLAFWIALLSVPQTVHYILDGLIWKMNPRNPGLADYLGLARKK